MRNVFIIATLALLIAFAAYATESDPSNTVGFIKIQNFGHGFVPGFNPFALSFDYYKVGYIPTDSVEYIVGDQAAFGDEIWSQNPSQPNTLVYIGSWFGSALCPLTNTDAYWYRHTLGTDTINITTAGEVFTGSVNYGPLSPGFNQAGIPSASTLTCEQLDLDDIAGIGNLELWIQNGSTATYLASMSMWIPASFPIDPGYAIWVRNLGSTTGDWILNISDDGRGTSGARMAPVPPQTRSVDRATTPSNTKNVPTPTRRVR